MFVQNPVDHCVYQRETEHDKVIILIWVDDLVIAACDESFESSKRDAYCEVPDERCNECVTMSQQYGVHFRTSSFLRLNCQTQMKRRQFSNQKSSFSGETASVSEKPLSFSQRTLSNQTPSEKTLSFSQRTLSNQTPSEKPASFRAS